MAHRDGRADGDGNVSRRGTGFRPLLRLSGWPAATWAAVPRQPLPVMDTICGMHLERIISGGQTGVDRAGLDAAMALGIPHGGWCPRGRRAEDGIIPSRYVLAEHSSADYAPRTVQNVLDADGTMVLCVGTPTGGTLLTCQVARQHRRPLLVVDLDQLPPPEAVRSWLEEHKIRVLNVAGPRESQSPGIGQRARAYLMQVLTQQAGARAARAALQGESIRSRGRRPRRKRGTA